MLQGKRQSHKCPTGIVDSKHNCAFLFLLFPGSISALVRWSTPRDDGDAVVSGYQVFVDNKLHGEPLPRSALETHVRVRNLSAFCGLSDNRDL